MRDLFSLTLILILEIMRSLLQSYNTFLFVAILAFSCNQTTKLSTKSASTTQLDLLDPEVTGIDFTNPIQENLYFNFINYSYIFNGGGVAAGDINNDGLIDLYFTANQTENKLYLNKGNFQFEDITKTAGVADKIGWSSGVTMVDINNDGWLDIYVSKSGSLNDDQLRANKLFVNQQNNTFKEEAREWGIDFTGYSTQAHFFDYDKDDDLDMFLVNHRADFERNDEVIPLDQVPIVKKYSNQLYRNEGSRFIMDTNAAGLETMTWGLSAAIGDFNEDGWDDIYVCNDFLQPDYMYINNQDGTFTNQFLEVFDHLSQHSMGSDYADINNDGLYDLVVLEMSPEDHQRSKQNMPSMSTKDFHKLVESGYHYQYMVNTLQVNNGNGYFSDHAAMSGIAKTDWSWAPLLADLDEDGYDDLVVTNGVLKDLANSDYRNKIMTRIASRVKMSLEEAQAMVPSTPLVNYVYRNNGDLTFEKKNKEWGFSETTFSNGASYADLDNDGDLDLVINNVNDVAHVYRNNSTNSSLSVQLKGSDTNKLGIGARVVVNTGQLKQEKTLHLTRGYLSSVSTRMHFGLGEAKNVESVKVYWPDHKVSSIANPDLSEILVVSYADAKDPNPTESTKSTLLQPENEVQMGLTFNHADPYFNDFGKQVLIPHQLSQLGPFMAAGDVNGDGLTDVYIGGAAGTSGELYIQSEEGFSASDGPWQQNQSAEEAAALFFDYDGDGDQDLYVMTGSYEFDNQSSLLSDNLYRNDGHGRFTSAKNVLPKIRTNGKTVKAADIDQDGDLDLFLGGRVLSGRYPLSPDSYLLENQGNKFVDITQKSAQDLRQCGMVTGAEFTDFDQDGDQDLIVVGEWSPIRLYENDNGVFTASEIPILAGSTGLWFSVKAKDIDGDGDDDYLVGNLGLNAKFKVGKGKEFHIYSDDFDKSGNYDIVLTNKYNGGLVPVRGLECSSEQIPGIKEEFKSFESFATASLFDIYGEQNLNQANHIQAHLLYSILLKNNGENGFEMIALPKAAQVAPIMDFEFVDIDNDEIEEILVVGNMYEAEVETVRYDTSKGVVLKYNNGAFSVLPASETGFFVKGNTRDIALLSTSKGRGLVVSRNNDKVKYFTLLD